MKYLEADFGFGFSNILICPNGVATLIQLDPKFMGPIF